MRGIVTFLLIVTQNTFASSKCSQVFLNEAVAADQMKARFEQEYLPKLKGGVLEILPDGPIPEIYRDYLNGVIKLLNDPLRFFSHLQELEKKVEQAVKNHKTTPEDSLLKILEESESSQGFLKAIDLINSKFSDGEWYKMLSRGALFNDVPLRAGLGTLQKDAHGKLTHRIQWYVISADATKNPLNYGTLGNIPPASEVYKLLGNQYLLNQISGSISKENPPELWYYLFDEYPSKHSPYPAFTSPEVLRASRKYWSRVGNWE